MTRRTARIVSTVILVAVVAAVADQIDAIRGDVRVQSTPGEGTTVSGSVLTRGTFS